MADAGIRLTVEGEKEFRAALRECDEAVKENKKSLKLLSEEYKLNETGMKDLSSGFGSMADAAAILADKGKVLADSIEIQTEKVGLLEARVEEASAAYGENDKRTQELRDQLLDASTALTKLTAEQEKNRQAMLDAQNSTKEYDDSVKALEAQLSANEAEMKALGGGMEDLRKEYGNLGKSTDDLRAKEDNLRRQNEILANQNDKLSDSITKQKDIIDNLTKAQETAVKRYGEGSKEAESYRKKIAEASGQLDAMERELRDNEKAIRDNNTALEEGGESPKGMIEGLEKIEQLTGIKIPAGIKDMIGGLDGGAVAVGGIVTALGAVASKMAEIYKDTIGWSRDITTASQELDLGTEEYQALEYAATKAGFPLDYFRNALIKINEKAVESDRVLGEWVGRMDELKYASEDVKEAVAEQMNFWNELGISLYDNEGNLKSTHDLMYEVIDAMGQLESKAEKDRVAMELFGKKFATVNPLIKTGTDQLKAFEDEAYRTGVVLSEDMVEKLNQAGAAWDTFGMRVEAAKKKIVAGLSIKDLIPGLNQLTFLQKIPDFFKTVFGISGYASGTNYAPGGLALVGERGPELVDLPRGSRVYPNGQVPAGVGGSVVNESNVYNISIDADSVEEFNDIVRIVKGARVGMRRG